MTGRSLGEEMICFSPEEEQLYGFYCHYAERNGDVN
jgi:hypothetical protein